MTQNKFDREKKKEKGKSKDPLKRAYMTAKTFMFLHIYRTILLIKISFYK